MADRRLPSVGLIGLLAVGCPSSRPSRSEPSLPVIAPLGAARGETRDAGAGEQEPTGKIWMCILGLDDMEPVPHRRFRLFDDGVLVFAGETDDGGCLERHHLPIGNYVLGVDGFDDIAAMLLDEDDAEPLNRMPHRARDAGPSP